MIRLGSLILKEDEMGRHVHCYGESGVGKSKCIECICRTLVGRKQGFIFVDPHGKTVYDLLKYFAFWKPRQRVYLLDTSRRDRIVGLCPFYCESKDPDELSVVVDGAVAATMKAWGHDPLATPRLGKWLKRLYWTIIEQDLPFTAIDHFLSYKNPKALAILKNSSPKVQEWWREIYRDRKEFTSFLESSESRLEMFQHPHLRRILSLKENSLDLEKIWDEGSILLVSLKNSNVMSEEHNRVVGTLLMNQLVQLALKRTDNQSANNKSLYLVLDECWKFITSDFRAILDETRKAKLSLLAFHQRMGQLDAVTASALTNAKTKLIFSTKENPKPDRHFECIRRGGMREFSVMHNVQDYFVKPDKVEEYIQSLLIDFYTRETVDRLLESTDYEKELDDDDFCH